MATIDATTSNVSAAITNNASVNSVAKDTLASNFTTFWRLIVPMSIPVIAAFAIFQFLWTWNDLLVALSLARDTQPLTVAIFSQLRQFGNNLELIAPASFVSLIVPLAVFFAFQRYFVQGLLAGSVK